MSDCKSDTTNHGWNIQRNGNLSYNDPHNQSALSDGLLRLAWYDYFLPGNFIIAGLINWIVFEEYD